MTTENVRDKNWAELRWSVTGLMLVGLATWLDGFKGVWHGVGGVVLIAAGIVIGVRWVRVRARNGQTTTLDLHSK